MVLSGMMSESVKAFTLLGAIREVNHLQYRHFNMILEDGLQFGFYNCYGYSVTVSDVNVGSLLYSYQIKL